MRGVLASSRPTAKEISEAALGFAIGAAEDLSVVIVAAGDEVWITMLRAEIVGSCNCKRNGPHYGGDCQGLSKNASHRPYLLLMLCRRALRAAGAQSTCWQRYTSFHRCSSLPPAAECPPPTVQRRRALPDVISPARQSANHDRSFPILPQPQRRRVYRIFPGGNPIPKRRSTVSWNRSRSTSIVPRLRSRSETPATCVTSRRNVSTSTSHSTAMDSQLRHGVFRAAARKSRIHRSTSFGVTLPDTDLVRTSDSVRTGNPHSFASRSTEFTGARLRHAAAIASRTSRGSEPARSTLRATASRYEYLRTRTTAGNSCSGNRRHPDHCVRGTGRGIAGTLHVPRRHHHDRRLRRMSPDRLEVVSCGIVLERGHHDHHAVDGGRQLLHVGPLLATPHRTRAPQRRTHAALRLRRITEDGQRRPTACAVDELHLCCAGIPCCDCRAR